MMKNEDLKVSLQPGEGLDQEPEYIDPSPADRAIATISAPRTAYSGLLRARNLGGVIGISLIVGIVTLFASFSLISETDVYREQMSKQLDIAIEQMGGESSLTPQQREMAIEMMKSSADQSPIMTFIGVFFMVPIATLLIALSVLVVSKILEKSNESYLRFSHALAVSALAIVPFGLLSLLFGIVQYLLEFNPANLSLAGLVDQSNPAVFMMASLISIPSLAYVASLAKGTSDIARSRFITPLIVLLILALVAYGALGYLQSFAMSMAG